MKILFVHNNYGKYSGEEAVVDKMASMYASHGHEVCFYRLTSEGCRENILGRVKGFFSGIYSCRGVKGMKNILKQERPDIVNIHNLYPFISPAALFECKKAGIPVVMTVHNYRLICPTGLFMRNGLPCERCLERGNEWGCILHNCEHSILKSVGYTLRNIYARWTRAYKDNVDKFACLTSFQKQKLIEAGFDARKITVIPNSVDVPDSYDGTVGSYVAYIGRLSYEKGYDLLLEVAAKHPEIEFRFAGAFRQQDEMQSYNNVKFMGHLDTLELQDFIKGAKFVVVPSRCYEGFPMAILEAAAMGKPCIGPDHGGFTEIIGQNENAIGDLFVPGNLEDLDQKIISLWNDENRLLMLGECAFNKLKKEYSSGVIYNNWESIFKSVLNNGIKG